MKKALIALAIVCVLVVAAGAVFVIADPARAVALIGMDSEPQPAEQAARQQEQEEFDRKAAEERSQQRQTAQRPPTREELEEQQELPRIQLDRRGRSVGPEPNPSTHMAPLPQLYPFEVSRRTYPTADTMDVEIAIQNASGIHWRNAYVTLQSSDHAEGHRFEINDWKIDEIVGLNYTFPRNQWQERMRGLRVVSVTGTQRESALAERISQTRRQRLEVAATGSGQTYRRRDGDVLNAPGLLGAIGRAQAPVTGLEVRLASRQSPGAAPLEITFPEQTLLSEDLVLNLRETSDERQRAVELAQSFHEAGLAVQEAAAAFARTLASAPYRQAMADGGGREQLATLEQRLATFNQRGVEFATLASVSRDREVSNLTQVARDHSRRVVGQVEHLEQQVRRADPSFNINR